MKLALVFLAVLGIAASPALAAESETVGNVLSFKISGSVVLFGHPMEGPFQVLPSTAGKGPLGGVTGQGLYVYTERIGDQGQMIGGPSQFAMRFDATGELLLLQITPGMTGTMLPDPAIPGAFTWTQTWTGTVIGGTGRFAGATGTFTKTASGFLVLPGFVSPWEGTITIALDEE
jgi:hypothetical protein